MDQPNISETPTAAIAATTPPATPAAPRSVPAWWTPLAFGVASTIIIGLVMLFTPGLGIAAVYAAIAAGILAVVGLVSLFISSQESRRGWGIAAGVLAAVAIISLVLSGPLHRVSAQQSLKNHQYQVAINEYQAIGEKAPYSNTLAQVYVDWAVDEQSHNAYGTAVDHLNYVIAKFPTQPAATKASTLLPGAHLAWAQYATKQNDAVTAGEQYNIVISQFGSAPAAADARKAAPAAFLAWGNALNKNKYYEKANTSYQLIIQGFKDSPEAATAHTQAAANLDTWAKELTTAHLYGDASTRYTDLATNYADTPQGQAAQALLNQGVQLIGRVFKSDGKTPAVAFTTIRLSSQWTVDGSTYTAGGQQYLAGTDANGYFIFPSVPPGQYLVEWRSTTGPYNTLFSGSTPTLVVTLRPLENEQLPDITSDQK